LKRWTAFIHLFAQNVQKATVTVNK